MHVETQRLLPGKDCRQQTLPHIDGVAERYFIKPRLIIAFGALPSKETARIFTNAGMKI